MNTISAIILAAGLSIRMGAPKQLLKWRNKTLIRIVTENVLGSIIDEALVVTGYRGKEVTAALKGLPVRIIYNPCYEQGQGASLASGVQAIEKSASDFMVFMSDQPLITPHLINMIIGEFKKRRCLALRPTYNGQPGHPVVFNHSLIAALKLLKGDAGARQVLKKLGNQVHYLPVQDEAVIFDIDTPEEFENLS